MINFPQNPFKRPGTGNPLAALRQSLTHDVLWNRRLFKAPALSIPSVVEPLPFTAARVTQRVRSS